MREYPTNAGERGAWQSHDGVVYRVENLVGQLQGAVAKCLVQKVVRRGHGSNEGILDGQAPSIGPTFANRSHNILDVTTWQRLEVRPTPARRRFAEGSVR